MHQDFALKFFHLLLLCADRNILRLTWELACCFREQEGEDFPSLANIVISFNYQRRAVERLEWPLELCELDLVYQSCLHTASLATKEIAYWERKAW